jgi:hypothetical protein
MRRQRTRIAAAVAAGIVILSVSATGATFGVATDASQQASVPPTSDIGAAKAPGGSGSKVTKTVRWNDEVGKSRFGTVTVSKTQHLSTREIVSISWKGFLPTVQPDGVESAHQAPQAPLRSGYPVVLLECQGNNPKTIKPEDCPIQQRFLYYANKDALETPEIQKASSYDSRPFLDTNGKLHKSPGILQPVPLPSDYNDSNVIGTNWYATWTENNGTRTDAKFEVRSTKEAPMSLGCGDPTTREHGRCSIVVVPIRPMHCVDKTSCLPPEETNAFSGAFTAWQTASNWRNKFVFPVSFKPFPDVCNLDSRLPVPTMGSWLLDEAMLSWLPKFCQSKSLFKLSFTRTNDSAARAALVTGLAGNFQSNLAFTTKPVESVMDRPIVNAPVAVTGFVVAFAIDNKGFEEVDKMRLNARLLAKLVTESYYTPPVPYLAKNPSDLLHDPEFRKLNPQLVKRLDKFTQIQNPVMVQGNPDLVWEVTRYIASDPSAVAWLKGKPDPWGMKVNPHYKGGKWPVPNAQFELRDPWTDKAVSGEKCEPKPVMEKAAQFVYDMLAATIALVDRQPQNFGVCKVSGQGGNVWAWSKPDRQPLGQRAMIAITDLAHARQYQLPSAALETRSGSFVTPSTTSLAKAVKAAKVDRHTDTITSNMTSRSRKAYPGMMPVYAAAPTKGLTNSEAAHYAKMIRWMVTDGQRYGDAAGRLPAGYLSLPKNMRAQALAAARHIAAQDGFNALPNGPGSGPPGLTNPSQPGGPGSTLPGTTPGSQIPGQVPPGLGGPTSDTGPGSDAPPSASAPSADNPSPGVDNASDVDNASTELTTQSDESGLAGKALPILILVAALGILAVGLILLSGRIKEAGGVRPMLSETLRRVRPPSRP